MAEQGTPSTATRRGLVVALYALSTALLLHIVASDLPWIAERLAAAGSAVPEDVRLLDDPGTFIVLASGGLAATLAVGTFLISRRTGTGFAILSAATVTWILFPYAEVPWAVVLGGPASQTFEAPGGAWLMGGLVVLLATVELGASARDRLLVRLDQHDLDIGPGSPARQHTAVASIVWLGLSVLVGSAAALLYALSKPLTEGWIEDPDLLWVPAIAGLVGGLALWLWARD